MTDRELDRLLAGAQGVTLRLNTGHAITLFRHDLASCPRPVAGEHAPRCELRRAGSRRCMTRPTTTGWCGRASADRGAAGARDATRGVAPADERLLDDPPQLSPGLGSPPSARDIRWASPPLGRWCM